MTNRVTIETAKGGCILSYYKKTKPVGGKDYENMMEEHVQEVFTHDQKGEMFKRIMEIIDPAYYAMSMKES